MFKSNNKSLGNHAVSPEEEKERLQWEGFAEKGGFKSGMKQRVADGHVLALEMASPGNQHSAYCIGTLSFPIVKRLPEPTTVHYYRFYRATLCLRGIWRFVCPSVRPLPSGIVSKHH